MIWVWATATFQSEEVLIIGFQTRRLWQCLSDTEVQPILEPPNEVVDAPLTEFQFMSRINHVTPYADRVLCIALIFYQKIIGGLTKKY